MTRFVLIPGAGGAAWVWHRVVAELQCNGHEAIAVDLPADDPHAALPQYAALVAEAIGARRDTVLVAASLGGFTAPMAALRAPVAEIVLVNAMVPLPGETPGQWWDATDSESARQQAARRAGYPAEMDLDVYFLHDVDPEVAASGLPHQRDEADVVFGCPCAIEAWPAVATRVLVGRDERFFPVEFQQRVARERLGLEASVRPGGHLMPLSQPQQVAAFLTAGDSG